jgi:hypothetical protein
VFEIEEKKTHSKGQREKCRRKKKAKFFFLQNEKVQQQQSVKIEEEIIFPSFLI